jgi:calcineurin-like phosphoesterase family protein
LVKLKGSKYGVTGVLWHALKKREKEGDLLVVAIGDFMTSRICNICYENSLKKVDGMKGHIFLGCQNCKTLRQRHQFYQEYAAYFIINMEW